MWFVVCGVFGVVWWRAVCVWCGVVVGVWCVVIDVCAVHCVMCVDILNWS